jgi:adenylate cyclase
MDKPESSHLIDTNSIMEKSQSRVWNTLGGEPGFIISVAETQNVLSKFASSKVTFVILNVDLVGSTKLSMTLPLDRLTKMIQTFNQEMSLIVKEFGGFVLKYVGDAVLAFFVVVSSHHQSQPKAACTRAINCARCMLQVTDNGINPILNQYNCPAMNLRIGIDIGENAIIQSGWDIHPGMIDVEDISDNNIIKKEQQISIKKPFYDILGYSTSIAVKMTALANPNHMAIGQLIYDVLDDRQKSLFQQLEFSPAIWSYANNNNEGNIYNVYTNT